MDLFAKAKELGIQTEYVDARGQRQVTADGALSIAIDALALDAPHPLLDRAVVIRSGRPSRTRLKHGAALPVRWRIASGDRVVADGGPRPGDSGGGEIDLPLNLPEGSYRLQVTDSAAVTDETPLIVAPARAFSGDFDRCWLLAAQLYGVRSARNWGIGDFSDLKRLIDLAARLGADGVGLNPLHALFDDRPADCSPYSPNSRLFLNPLYIDVENLAEFQPGAVAGSGEALGRLRAGDIVDYAGVAE